MVFGAGKRSNFSRTVELLAKGFVVFPGCRDTVKDCVDLEDLLDTIEFARGRRAQGAPALRLGAKLGERVLADTGSRQLPTKQPNPWLSGTVPSSPNDKKRMSDSRSRIRNSGRPFDNV